MSKKKTPWGVVVMLVGLVGAISYSKMADFAPAVGTIEEMQAREEERMKARAQEMAAAQPKALGGGSEAPSTSQVASAVMGAKEPNLTNIKRPRVSKSQVAMILNPAVKLTRDRVNESQPFGRFWVPESGRANLGQ